MTEAMNCQSLRCGKTRETFRFFLTNWRASSREKWTNQVTGDTTNISETQLETCVSDLSERRSVTPIFPVQNVPVVRTKRKQTLNLGHGVSVPYDSHVPPIT